MRAPSRRGRTWISANLTVEQVGLHFMKESLHSVQYSILLMASLQFVDPEQTMISKVRGTYSIISTVLHR